MSEKKFGLIGKTLKHSYSKIIHEKFGGYAYDLYEISPENLEEFVKGKTLDGYNVTIPYKKDIMPYLDYIDQSAKAIGAVNTVVNVNGKLYGYNTDFYGMVYTLKRAKIDLNGRTVAILGTGGTGNTAMAVAKSLNAKEIISVSRSGEVNYQNIYDRKDVEIIINTTPVGMFPNTSQSPIDLSGFPNLKGVFDVIYNPLQTKLTYQAERLGVKQANGLAMLVAQAKYAMEKFVGRTESDDIIEKVLLDLEKSTENIVLIGMPGSGKSTVGKRVAELLGREFIDTDAEIEKVANKAIPEIFSQDGEVEFRWIESEVLKTVGSLNGKVIATGGGVVKNPDNKFELKKNGRIYYLTRSIEKLATKGRPLSKDLETVKKLYQERKDKYEYFADQIIDNDGELEVAVKGVSARYEDTSY